MAVPFRAYDVLGRVPAIECRCDRPGEGASGSRFIGMVITMGPGVGDAHRRNCLIAAEFGFQESGSFTGSRKAR
jgi:hypothetical protein